MQSEAELGATAPRLGLVLLALVSAAAAPWPRTLAARPLSPEGGGPCTGLKDCHYGGECWLGRCVCDPEWTGPSCGQLNLRPARPGSGYPIDPAGPALPTSSVFTWGGAVVRGGDGLYHGFFTEYLHHCPMTYGTWTTQTQIRHAVSARADGPWQPRELAVPDAAGNPVMTRAPDGTWLLYFTNHRWKGPTRNCTGPVKEWTSPVYCPGCGTGMSLAYSRSLDGPWSVQYDVVKFSCTNPGAPVFLANGSLLMAYKTWSSAGRCLGVVRGDHWRAWPYKQFPLGGPSSCLAAAPELEDPSNLWLDRRGVVHLLFHNGSHGGAAASTDWGLSWDWDSGVAYNYTVDYQDGSVLACSHREEPKVLLGQAGQPVMLINQCTLDGELPPTPPSAKYPAGERQYITRVVMQPINTGG